MKFRYGTIVNNWRKVVYLDNEDIPVGWYCWVYPERNDVFQDWMDNNCPNAEVAYRFNSGDPMFTVYIPNDEEALMFSLKWL